MAEDDKTADVLPFSKAKQSGRKPRTVTGATPAPKVTKATKASKATKSTAKRAAAKPKAEGGIVRAASTVAKEGEQRDEFDGKTYPLTKFPTVRQSDGTYVRGTVTRENLPAWRAARKAKRAADAAASAAAKAEAKKAAAATKKATATS